MSTAFEKEDIHYTCADYLEWDTDERYEIIDGKAYLMSAPTASHQIISREGSGQFWIFLKGKPCRGAPDMVIEMLSSILPGLRLGFSGIGEAQ